MSNFWGPTFFRNRTYYLTLQSRQRKGCLHAKQFAVYSHTESCSFSYGQILTEKYKGSRLKEYCERSNIHSSAAALLGKMLSLDPKNRPTAEEALHVRQFLVTSGCVFLNFFFHCLDGIYLTDA